MPGFCVVAEDQSRVTLMPFLDNKGYEHRLHGTMGIGRMLFPEAGTANAEVNHEHATISSKIVPSHQRCLTLDAHFKNAAEGLQNNNSGAGNLINSSGSGQSTYNFAPSIANASVVNIYILNSNDGPAHIGQDFGKMTLGGTQPSQSPSTVITQNVQQLPTRQKIPITQSIARRYLRKTSKEIPSLSSQEDAEATQEVTVPGIEGRNLQKFFVKTVPQKTTLGSRLDLICNHGAGKLFRYHIPEDGGTIPISQDILVILLGTELSGKRCAVPVHNISYSTLAHLSPACGWPSHVMLQENEERPADDASMPVVENSNFLIRLQTGKHLPKNSFICCKVKIAVSRNDLLEELGELNYSSVFTLWNATAKYGVVSIAEALTHSRDVYQ